MNIKHFFDPETFTLTYVVSDEKTHDAVIIDPVLNFDPESGSVQDKSVSIVTDFIRSQELNVKAILETHAHADHLSGSQFLKKLFPEAIIGIGEGILIVQKVFKEQLQLESLKTDGSQFDVLLKDMTVYEFGSLKMKAFATPGHTPACMSYLFEDALFSGDALFMPDSGTGRCDFPNGCAHALYQSVHEKLYSLPTSTRVFVGHDYLPNGRELKFQTTIGDSKKFNIHLKDSTSEDEYVAFREARDKTLKAPKLLIPSIRVNLNAGAFPAEE